jgi:cell division protein ZapA
MKTVADGVTVTILGKELMVACPESERAQLRAAADYLDRKMREIQTSGKVIGAERAAIMAALNIAAELLELRGRGGLPDDVHERLQLLSSKIDAALNWDVQARQ